MEKDIIKNMIIKITNHDLNKIKKLDDEYMDEIINTERTKENNNNQKNNDEGNMK